TGGRLASSCPEVFIVGEMIPTLLPVLCTRRSDSSSPQSGSVPKGLHSRRVALCIEHGQKVPEAGRVKLPGELKGSLVLRYGCLEPIAALLLLRVIHECVLGLFQRAQNRRLIEDLGLFPAHVLTGDA